MGTKFEYVIKPSVSVPDYFYIVERETDEFGTTEDAVSKPMSKAEMLDLKNMIVQVVGD